MNNRGSQWCIAFLKNCGEVSMLLFVGVRYIWPSRVTGAKDEQQYLARKHMLVAGLWEVLSR